VSGDGFPVFDVGGTTTRMGLYDPASGALSQLTATATPNFLDHPHLDQAQLQAQLLDTMAALARDACGSRAIARVAVAFAGPISADGEVMAAPTIWGDNIGPVAFAAGLRGVWPGADVALLNDVTAAGYRHVQTGRESFCIITVSSGIGNKVFIDGRPVTGPAGRGGEIGHLRVDHAPSAAPCDCGGIGHLGSMASGRGTLAHARRVALGEPDGFLRSQAGALTGGQAERLDTRQIAAAFASGDDWTRRVVRDTASHLARALASLHVAIGLEKFVIYGGFASALGEQYRGLLVELAGEACWDTGQDWNAMIVLDADSQYAGLAGLGQYMALHAPMRAAA
jgi:C7-cyclitol 7-kinase